MIDREARNRAADLVDHFWGGLITNRDLERAWPESRDRSVRAVDDFIWTLYDDFEARTVRDDVRSDPQFGVLVPNCIAFLRSDETYTWPHVATIKGVERFPLWAVVLSLGALGLWNRRAEVRERQYWADMRAHGDVEAWPFTRKSPAAPMGG